MNKQRRPLVALAVGTIALVLLCTYGIAGPGPVFLGMPREGWIAAVTFIAAVLALFNV